MSRVDTMADREFINLLGGIYEHSPWVAEAVVNSRPFGDRDVLQQAMKSVVESASDEQKLNLLKAHPEFAGKAATEGQLSESSSAEQSRLSLHNLPSEQHRQMQHYNKCFVEKFGFPGIVAVRLNRSIEEIFTQFDRRLQNDPGTEVEQALEQVHAIVEFRLHDLVAKT